MADPTTPRPPEPDAYWDGSAWRLPAKYGRWAERSRWNGKEWIVGEADVREEAAEKNAPSVLGPAFESDGVLSTIGSAIAGAAAWVSNRHNWVRVAWALSGSVIILIGVAVLIRPAVKGGNPSDDN